MRRFFAELGWDETHPESKSIAEYRGGGAWLSLLPHELLIDDAKIAPATGAVYRGLSIGHQVADREAVQQVINAAVSAGAVRVKDATDTAWGGRSGYFLDPEGNLWEVAWNPERRFDAAGNLLT
jgi:uncharacterized glyoxalase superfamily protein PhnB